MSDDLVKRLRSKIITHTDAAVWMLEAAGRIEELEAKLAKAVLSVKRLSTSECFGSSEVWGLSLSDSPLGREILARMDYANTTLAELEGETDE